MVSENVLGDDPLNHAHAFEHSTALVRALAWQRWVKKITIPGLQFFDQGLACKWNRLLDDEMPLEGWLALLRYVTIAAALPWSQTLYVAEVRALCTQHHRSEDASEFPSLSGVASGHAADAGGRGRKFAPPSR